MTLEQEMDSWEFNEDEKENVRAVLSDFDYDACLAQVIEFVREEIDYANGSIYDAYNISFLNEIIEDLIDNYDRGIRAANPDCIDFLIDMIKDRFVERIGLEIEDNAYFHPPKEYFLI